MIEDSNEEGTDLPLTLILLLILLVKLMRSPDLPEVLVIIAHDKETQALLDQHQISRGTQYELARGFLDAGGN